MKTSVTYTISEHDAGKTAADYLLDLGFSSRLVASLRSAPGSFLLDGQPIFSNRRLRAGETLTVIVTEQKRSDAITPVPLEIPVLFEDEHLIIVNKPAGMPVHPSQGNHDNTLANGMAWLKNSQGLPFVFRAVNRLDKDTSGILVLAQNQLSSCMLSNMAASHQIHREYLAVACGKTEEAGTIAIPIGRKPGSIIERMADPQNGDEAVTDYLRLDYDPVRDLSLLAVRLHTGRTHQIRVHLKAIGHPLPGDFLYCPDYRYISRQALHSSYIRLVHPITGRLLEITAPLPSDMVQLFPEFCTTGACFS